MDIILVPETIVGSLVEATTTAIKVDRYHCLLISHHVLLHLWEPKIMIVIMGITEEAEGGIIIKGDRTLLVLVAAAAAGNYLTSLRDLL